MMCFPLVLSVLFYGLLVSATSPTPTRAYAKRNSDVNPAFVSVVDNQFMFNGSQIDFVGTNAYWLATLNSDKDINDTLHSIAAKGIKVVRTWAFNDVSTIPVNGTWFQLIQNNTITINNGSNGLARLDKVVQFAEQAGVQIVFSLTNNWNPLPLIDNNITVNGSLGRRDVTLGTNNSLPRNFLSNDYGGMDLYVRQLGVSKQHDEFYTNQTILNAFMSYTTQVVSRYVNSSAIFSWELANDPRCQSSLPASPSCDTTTVTLWHAQVAAHVRSVDSNHVVSSGANGFMCMTCPKSFPLTPQPSPSATIRKRNVLPLTQERILRERIEKQKRNLATRKRAGDGATGKGIRIRGRWISTETRRQVASTLGPAFDGSQGVDSQDITNIPDIGFGTFQLFPDQNTYGVNDPNLPAFNNTVLQGIEWIQLQAHLAQMVNKPSIMTGFGLVTQNNANFFVPFNSSVSPITNGTLVNSTGSLFVAEQPFGVSNEQQDDAYSQWIAAAATNGISGVTQYQWGQGNLTMSPGTTISPNDASSGTSPNDDQSGISPNDGYGISATGQDGVQPLLSDDSSLFQPISSGSGLFSPGDFGGLFSPGNFGA